MHIYAHGSIFIEFHVQMCMCNVMCTHAHRMLYNVQQEKRSIKRGMETFPQGGPIHKRI